MVAFNGSEPCGRAEVYYHDFLVDGNDPSIPPGVREHIKRCAHCRRRLARLRDLLNEGERPAAPRVDAQRAVIGHLESHFRLLGERVTCRHVKRFLPGLLDSSARIRIPTPVTVHIDHCPACAADLESLKALKLDGERLARLGHLYADGSCGGWWVCLRVQARLSVGRRGSLKGLDHEVLDHLCVCPRCRRRVYQQRQRRLDHESTEPNGRRIVCHDGASIGDIFDLVVPYGNLHPECEDERRRACGAHLRSCSVCLERAQAMYRVVYGILERPDSGVVTVCTACAKDPDEFDQGRGLYAGYPIHTEVLEAEAAGPPRRFSGVATRLRPVLKPAIMAAALIPLLAALVFSTAPVSALSPHRIKKIFNEAPNVHVRIFGEDGTEPVQELWASQPQKILAERDRRQTVVFDLAREELLIKGADGLRRTVPMDQTYREAAERRMDGLLGLSLGQRQWNAELTGPETSALGSNFERYTLDWQDRNGRRCRWEIHVAVVTRRPVQAEFFAWDPIAKDLMREETRQFEYPDEDAFRQQVNPLLGSH